MAKWQTHYLEVVAPVRVCRFDSCPAHKGTARKHVLIGTGIGSFPGSFSPLRGFSLAAEGYVFSVFTYWFGYGVLLAVVSSVLSLIFRDTVGLDTHAIAAAVVFGPLYGGLLDFELAFSASWGAPFGIAMLVVEPFLFFLFFFSSEWRERFKYLALMAVFVIVKTVIYTLVIKGI